VVGSELPALPGTPEVQEVRKFTGDIGRSVMSALLSRRVLAPRMERTVEDGGPQSTSNP
jgi:hypothetical protein